MQLTAVLMLLATVRPDSPIIVIWAYAILLGLGVGAWLPTLSMLASTSFGLLFYGAVFGALNLCQSLGTAAGPLVAGTVHDVTGTYYWAFVTYAADDPLSLALKRYLSSQVRSKIGGNRKQHAALASLDHN